MIRNYHNHKLQTNPRHHEEGSQNTSSHKTSGRQQKQSNLLSLPRQDYFKTRNKHQKKANTEPALTM